jgi:tetratricopeptide (TPR) repeat protein/transglutaminase-like putative cysteine protease
MHFLFLTTVQFRYPHSVILMNRASLALSSLLLVSTVAAQTPATQSVTSQQQSASAPDTARSSHDFSHEPIIYEFVHVKMRYEKDGTGVRDTTARIRVKTAAGLPRVGQLVLDYNAANEKMEIRSFKVIKPDGSTITAGPDAVQDLSAPVTQQAPMYTDAQQKHVTVPGLAVGDAIEYNVVTTSSPIIAGQFWYTRAFVAGAVSLDEQVELNVPRDRALKIKSPPGVEPIVRDDRDRRIYHWSTSTLEYSNAPNFLSKRKFDVKAMLGDLHLAPPRQILFSTFQSWEEVGRWYALLENDRRTATPEIRAKAEEIVQDRTDAREKAEVLYNWVSRNIRYVSLSFGVGRFQPHAAAEVLQNRYGDCKDKATLLEALFDAEGLHAQPVLINSRMDVDPAVPSPLQFDHAITFLVLDGHDTWLDSTMQVAPFGYLLPQLRGKEALVVTTDVPPGLKRSPDALANSTLYKVAVNGEVRDDRKLDAKFALDTRSDLEVLLRMLATLLSPSQMTAMMEQAATQTRDSAGDDFNLSDLKTSDPTDTSKPFHVEVHFHGQLPESALKSDAASPEEIAWAIASGVAGSDALLSILPSAEAKPIAAGKPERLAVTLGGPKEYLLQFSLTLPPSKELGDRKPITRVHVTNEFAEYKSIIGWQNQTLLGSWSLDLRVPQLSAYQAGPYADFRQKVLESLHAPSSSASPVRQPPASTAANNPFPPAVLPASTPEATAFYKQGDEAYKRKDWANSEAAFDSAAKFDPEYALAWRELGRSRMELRKYADAETAFWKYLELAPNDPYAYSSVVWALNAQKKYDDSIELLKKRLASNPNDAPAQQQLGGMYLVKRQPDLAVPKLQKGITLNPNVSAAHHMLAQAYVQLKDFDKAAASYQRAIDLDSSPLTLNNVAYELSVANTHLDLADTWSTRAVHAVELELNQARLPFQSQIMFYTNQIAAFWDTLGWIKFQKHDLAAAHKYLFASAQLASDPTVSSHLGRVYEAQNQTDDAIEAYAEALALKPATRGMSDDEKEAQKSLTTFLGGDVLIENRVKAARAAMADRRSVSIPNSGELIGISEYMLIVGPGSELADVMPFTSDDPLATITSMVRAAAVPQSFPDDVIQKLPRMGTLSCPSAERPCTLTLMPAVAASRVVAPAPPTPGEQ